MTSDRIAGVAFDMMDTLLYDPWREALGAALGDRLKDAMAGREPSAWPEFETGAITEDEFWQTHAAFDPDPVLCREVRLAKTVWLDGMRQLVADCRAAGIATSVASNYPVWFEDVEHTLLADVADVNVVSYRIGVRKPDAEFYDAVASAMDLGHDLVAFVDDRQTNIDGAEATGMAGILFTDADTTRAALIDLGVQGL